MTLKEIIVTSPGSVEAEVGEKIPVHFSYGLSDKKDFKVLTERNNQYIFTAFVVKDSRSLYVFGDARRHEELEKAIVEDIGALDRCIYGQLWLLDSKAKSLTFKSPLGKNDRENKDYLLNFLDSIDSEFLGERISINDNENIYEYKKITKNLKSINRY
jgi:hypothetical protein